MICGLFSRKGRRSAARTGRFRGRSAVREDYLADEPTAPDPDPLREALRQGRWGWILAQRSEWRGHPAGAEILQSADRELDERYGLVPEGYVSLPQTIGDYPGCPETDLETSPFLIARTTVTNGQFQKFVDAGGYQDLTLWPKETWSHLIDFKDQTEHPGPRFWKHGRHDRRRMDHPVVGICYFEAAAYAQWAGVRLPTEAEWQMAASWRIRSCAQVLRRYPWGDALDVRRCNIWATNLGETSAVDAFASGAAPNGALQLIGNVWEWTISDFAVTDVKGRPILGDMLSKSIRGGAFDTYFPAQTTSLFRTGLGVLFRMHNVGFRCAVDVGGGDSTTAEKED